MADGPVSEYVHARPAAPLRPFIGWYSGYRDVGAAPAVHRGLPSPYLTLIVTLDDPLAVAAHPDPRTPPGRYDILLGGLHTSPALITHDGRQSGIQVALSPLGARALFGLPAGEIAGADLDAADVLGRFAGQIRERLLAARGWTERFAVLDRLLSRRLDGYPAVRPEVAWAWDRLLRSTGAVSVSALAAEVGWSSRYLNRRFGVEIGLGPKTAARVVRFDTARRLLQRRLAGGGELGLASLAAECGYFDQAHLARDFGEFAGCPASRWLREEFRNVQAAAVVPLPDFSA